MRRLGWLLPALIAAALLGACGGDDEPSAEDVRKPELTVPQEEPAAEDEGDEATDTTETEPSSGDSGPGSPDGPMDQPNPGNGGVPAPDSNNPPAEEPPDTPQNDRPPEPGSPAERFEQFCAQNPGAC